MSAWASRLGGGVYEALRGHARALQAFAHVDVEVFALEDRHSAADRASWGEIPLSLFRQRGPQAFGYTPGLTKGLLDADLDVLHLHGIWMYPSACGAAWAARTRRPYIISPHGMLERWITARGRWKKALARKAYEERNWRAATAFHALTPAEAGDITAALDGLAASPALLTIPNAVALQPLTPGRPPGPASVLYLGRIHPKKNLDALLDAWPRRAGPREGSRLTIAGWGEPDHVAALEARIAGAADPTIEFVGPVYGAAKQARLAAARFLILPSFSEGLPMTILEAWASGTPALMTRACNLPAGFAHGAALETPTTAAGIAATLDAALALAPDEWSRMSRAAHALARRDYGAEGIAARWATAYASLAGRAAPRAAAPPRMIA